MSSPTRIIVVCEDECHKRLAQGFLSVFNYPFAKVQVVMSPSGQGDAKAFVKVKAKEWSEMVKSRPFNTLRLLIMADADAETVEERLQFLYGSDWRAFPHPTIVFHRNSEEYITQRDDPESTVETLGKKQAKEKIAHRVGKEVGATCRSGLAPTDQLSRFCDSLKPLLEDFKA